MLQCVEESIDIVLPRIKAGYVDLVYQIDDDVPLKITGDIGRLRQVLVNLLTNAIKFTPKGEVVLYVDSNNIKDKRHEIHFVVEDTGIGISKERMNRLFKSFSQVDSSTTRKYGGTGLGLAISKQLVEMMGGRIWVESEENIGSKFHFTIITEESELPDKKEVFFDATYLKNKQILVVDDNRTNLEILAKQLGSWGISVLQADNWHKAVELLEQSDRIEMAILDYHMPEVDGFQLAQKIHALPAYTNLPLVLLSSLGHKADKEVKMNLLRFWQSQQSPLNFSMHLQILLV